MGIGIVIKCSICGHPFKDDRLKASTHSTDYDIYLKVIVTPCKCILDKVESYEKSAAVLIDLQNKIDSGVKVNNAEE